MFVPINIRMTALIIGDCTEKTFFQVQKIFVSESELCSEVRPMASSMKRAQTFSSPQDGTRPRVPMRNQTMRLVE